MEVTPLHMDALKELVNIGVGRGSELLSKLCESYVDMQVLKVDMVDSKHLQKCMELFTSDNLSSVSMSFKGPVTGKSMILFPPESASNLVTALTGEEPMFQNLDSVRVATLNEVGNIILSGVIGTVMNIIHKKAEYSIPSYNEDSRETICAGFPENEMVVLAQTNFQISKSSINGDILLVFEMDGARALLDAIEATMPGK